MKIISTWLFDPWLSGHTQGWRRTVDMLAAMRASSSLAQRRLGSIAVHTNSLSAPWLKRILPGVELIVSHDDSHRFMPTNFYSWCKLWTWRLQTQPFLHLDLDFLVGHQWPTRSVTQPLLGQWWENVTDTKAQDFYDWHQHGADLALPAGLLDIDPAAPALNTGCLQCRDLVFMRDYVETVEDLVKINAADQLPVTVPTLEQHVLGMMIQRRGIECAVLIGPDEKYMPVNNQFIHFLGRRWKDRDLPLANSVLSQTLDSWIDAELLQVAQALERCRSQIYNA